MTREEAIKILKFERGYFCDLKGCQELQAFTMAIKALEQEPCIDAISRQAVMDLPKNTERDFFGKIIEQSINIEYIKALPPVNPTEKVGRWITDRCDMYTCSKCNHTYTDLSGERYGMNFCPNCGSRMVQEVEG